MFNRYYQLTKPGIIYGNAVTAAAGFFLAAKGNINFLLLIADLLGLSFIIASACVFNNYIDRNIDKEMARTKKRALVTGEISQRNALIFASILGILGSLILILHTNFLTFFVAFVGFFFYVVMYSIYKRRSEFGTIVGSISGAVPPVVGYCGVTNRFDMGALLLFLILVVWQMPHFYAIGIYRLKDYANAGIPILPVKKGIPITKIHMIFYIIAFIILTNLLTIYGFTGKIYLIIILVLGLSWLGYAMKGFKTKHIDRWARKMFLFSLIILTIFSILISIDVAFR